MKRALISGASSGIGLACAEQLAKSGCHLVLLARRSDRLQEIKKRLEAQFHIEVDIASVDIRNSEQVNLFFKTFSTKLKDTSIVINNAGLALGTDKMTVANSADWDVMIDTNIKGLLYVTRGMLPFLLTANAGHIVNIGSVAGRWVYPGGGVYCATKFAVRALSEGLRMDLLGTHIRVTNIEPGMVETEFSQVRLQDKEKAKAVYAGMEPLSAVDIAETVGWCLDRPAHVNIQELVIFPTDQAAIQQVQRRS